MAKHIVRTEEETLRRACKQIEKNYYELRSAMNNLGGKNDRIARKKITNIRRTVKNIMKNAQWAVEIKEDQSNEQETMCQSNSSNVNVQSKELCNLRLRYKELTAMYERINKTTMIEECITKGNAHEYNDESDGDGSDNDVNDEKSENKNNNKNQLVFANQTDHHNTNNDNDNSNDINYDNDDNISDERHALLQQVQPQADMSKFAQVKEIRQQRLENIREIEEDVIDLKSTYEEFHSLVHQQQSGIDTIQSNVENAQVLVDNGTEELQAASSYQKNSKKIACILFIVLVCVLVTVAVVIFALTQKAKIK